MNCVAGFWTSDKSMVREIEWLCGFCFPVYRAEIFIAHHIVTWPATFPRTIVVRWGHVSSSCQCAGCVGDVCYFCVADSVSGTRPPLLTLHSNCATRC